MSKDNVKKFFEALEKDENLTRNYLEAMKEYHEQAGKIIAERLVNFAAGHGFLFTAEDLSDIYVSILEALKNNGELSSEELATFSGGTFMTCAQLAMVAANAINAQKQVLMIQQAQVTQSVTSLRGL